MVPDFSKHAFVHQEFIENSIFVRTPRIERYFGEFTCILAPTYRFWDPLLAPVGPTIAPKNVPAARKIGKQTPSVEFQGLVASRIASRASFGLHFDGFGTDLRLTLVDARIIFGSVASGASLGLQFGRSGTDDR